MSSGDPDGSDVRRPRGRMEGLPFAGCLVAGLPIVPALHEGPEPYCDQDRGRQDGR